MAMEILFIDTETTARTAKEACAVEVGAQLMDVLTGEILWEFDELCNPGKRALSASTVDAALAVSGITRDMLASARSSRAVAADLNRYIREITGRGVSLAGYNSDHYDSVVLNKAPWNIQRTLWKYDVMLIAYDVMMDMGALQRLKWDNEMYKWPSLAEAQEFFKVNREGGAHRAKSDARVTGHIMSRIVQEYPEYQEKLGITGLVH